MAQTETETIEQATMPEHVWLTFSDPHWWPTEEEGDIKYVRKDIADTAVREAVAETWKAAIEIARSAGWATKNHDVGAHELEECATCAAAQQSTEVVTALESAKGEKS